MILVLPVCISMTFGGTVIAAPALIDRSKTNYWAGVRAEKEIELFQDGGLIKKEKDI